MLVQCPGCSAPYDVPDRTIPPGGRQMRCPKCSQIFLVMGPAVGEGARSRRTAVACLLAALVIAGVGWLMTRADPLAWRTEGQAADSTEGLGRAIAANPEPPVLLGHWKIDGDFGRDAMLLLPFGEVYAEVMEEQCAAFAAQTGFNPLDGWKSMSVVASEKTARVFFETAGDVKPLMQALQADPALGAEILFEGPDRGRVAGHLAFRIVPGGLWLAPIEAMSRLDLEAKPAPMPGMALAALQLANGPPKLFLALDLTATTGAARWASSNEGLKQVALSADGRTIGLFAEGNDLSSLHNLSAKILDPLRAELARRKARTAQAPGPSTPLQLLHPATIETKVTQALEKRLTEAVSISLTGSTVRVLVDRKMIPSGSISSLAILAAAGAAANVAIPNFTAARERANVRACFANQKTIAGAIEMYNLDNNSNASVIDDALARALVNGGYLQSLPDDPGAGAGTFMNYRLVSTGNGILCVRHGDIQSGGRHLSSKSSHAQIIPAAIREWIRKLRP